jgi:hypothetical protein
MIGVLHYKSFYKTTLINKNNKGKINLRDPQYPQGTDMNISANVLAN